ncbi:MAG: division/cell wall cluster transcriptional repressor MraZ [bacterium]|nr:division/cell wall cluster transcriptional repressor MraZ [bacterium]
MFVGTYYNKLEAKGRFTLPKAFRQDNQDWVLTTGLDGCLFLFAEAEFAREAEKLEQLSYYKADHRALVRHLAGNASQQSTDQLGRLSLPEALKGYAGIDKNIVVVGSLSRIEIWDQTRYHELLDKLNRNVEIAAENVNA